MSETEETLSKIRKLEAFELFVINQITHSEVILEKGIKGRDVIKSIFEYIDWADKHDW